MKKPKPLVINKRINTGRVQNPRTIGNVDLRRITATHAAPVDAKPLKPLLIIKPPKPIVMKQAKRLIVKLRFPFAVFILLTANFAYATAPAETDAIKPYKGMEPEAPPSDTLRVKKLFADNNTLLEYPHFSNLRKYSILGINKKKSASDDSLSFKPTVQAGAIVHLFAFAEQDGYSKPSAASDAWNRGFLLYRCRLLLGGRLSRKASFFMETELPSAVGASGNSKNVKVAPVILDAQFQYNFSEAFQLIAGKQLISNNRNGLQGAAALMANDFSYFQYPYNLFANSPLQGNFGRDLGVNARGFLFRNKLEYRAGVFTGRNVNGKGPLRYTGRLAYNFLETEKDYYYSGTNLGQGKTLTWGA
ncbi:MAG: hypothetical protein CRN43_18885, partial [Candidatus Nephrothrix sp. EaCA]